MNLVDSCGWIEYFADGPNAGLFYPVIKDADRLIVPSVCILEVFKRSLQQRGEAEALDAVGAMRTGHIVPLGIRIAMRAAEIGIETRLPLADSIILATAQAYQATIWTQDTHFQTIPGVKYIQRQ